MDRNVEQVVSGDITAVQIKVDCQGKVRKKSLRMKSAGSDLFELFKGNFGYWFCVILKYLGIIEHKRRFKRIKIQQTDRQDQKKSAKCICQIRGGKFHTISYDPGTPVSSYARDGVL